MALISLLLAKYFNGKLDSHNWNLILSCNWELFIWRLIITICKMTWILMAHILYREQKKNGRSSSPAADLIYFFQYPPLLYEHKITPTLYENLLVVGSYLFRLVVLKLSMPHSKVIRASPAKPVFSCHCIFTFKGLGHSWDRVKGRKWLSHASPHLFFLFFSSH